MARKRYTTEQIIGLLREARSPGPGSGDWHDLPGLGVSEQSYYRWRCGTAV